MAAAGDGQETQVLDVADDDGVQETQVLDVAGDDDVQVTQVLEDADGDGFPNDGDDAAHVVADEEVEAGGVSSILYGETQAFEYPEGSLEEENVAFDDWVKTQPIEGYDEEDNINAGIYCGGNTGEEDTAFLDWLKTQPVEGYEEDNYNAETNCGGNTGGDTEELSCDLEEETQKLVEDGDDVAPCWLPERGMEMEETQKLEEDGDNGGEIEETQKLVEDDDDASSVNSDASTVDDDNAGSFLARLNKSRISSLRLKTAYNAESSDFTSRSERHKDDALMGKLDLVSSGFASPKGQILQITCHELVGCYDNGESNRSCMQDKHKDESEDRKHSSTVKKLFEDLSPAKDIGCLDYITSQEPGDLTQANAMEIVDKFISINDIQLSQKTSSTEAEDDTVRSVPLVNKGSARLLAKCGERIVDLKTQIYDWVDSYEDESGGAFFSRRKKCFFKAGDPARNFSSLPPKRKLDSTNVGDATKSSSLGKYVHSDSRLVLQGLGGDEAAVSKCTKKNLFGDLGEPRSLAKSMEKRNDEISGVDCSAGPDTQIAAEAMEALIHSSPKISLECEPFVIQRETKKRRGVDVGETTERSKRKRATSSAKNNVGCSDVAIVNGLAISSPVARRTRSSGRNKRDQSETARVKELFSGIIENLPDSGGTDLVDKDAGVLPSSNNLFENQSCAVSTSAVKPTDELAKSGTVNFDELCRKSSADKISHKKAYNAAGGIKYIKNYSPVAGHTRSSRKNKGNLLELSNSSPKKYLAREVTPIGSTHIMDSDINPLVDMPVSATGTGEKSGPFVDKTLNGDDGDIDTSKPREGEPECEDACKFSYSRRKKSRIALTSSTSGKTVGISGRDTGSSTELNISGKKRRIYVRSASELLDKAKRERQSKPPRNDLFSEFCESSGVLPQKGTLVGENLDTPIKRSGAATTTTETSSRVSDPSPVFSPKNPSKVSRRGSSRASVVRELINLDGSPELKSSRRRKDIADVSVLFSRHLGADEVKKLRKILVRLGVVEASSMVDATHFVADSFQRTRNMLEAIALGKPVVTSLWLISCGQAGCFIDEKKYILRDAKKEKEMGFNMCTSLALACKHALLQGIKVFITPSVSPSRDIIADLVKASSGQVLERMTKSLMSKDHEIPDNLVIISCEEDYQECVPFLERGANILSAEFLLNGIIIQKLEFDRHRLFVEDIKRTRSTLWLKDKPGGRFRPVSKA